MRPAILLPLVIILDADDIILTDIGPCLDFDQFERDLALVCQTVQLTDRDIDRLVFRQKPRFLAHRHRRRALDHDPVFRAMIMFLERDPMAGIDRDVADPVTFVHIHVFDITRGR